MAKNLQKICAILGVDRSSVVAAGKSLGINILDAPGVRISDSNVRTIIMSLFPNDFENMIEELYSKR
jgi:hypothetical protein